MILVFLGSQSIFGSKMSDFIDHVMCHETKRDEGRGQKKNEIMWEKFPTRLRRLYGKIAEVMWFQLAIETI